MADWHHALKATINGFSIVFLTIYVVSRRSGLCFLPVPEPWRQAKRLGAEAPVCTRREQRHCAALTNAVRLGKFAVI
jgi:hypothetical protein